MSLFLPGQCEVDAWVVHDRTGEAHFAGSAFVMELCWGVQLTGFHVVVEAERVADFVQDEIIDACL